MTIHWHQRQNAKSELTNHIILKLAHGLNSIIKSVTCWSTDYQSSLVGSRQLNRKNIISYSGNLTYSTVFGRYQS